MDTFKGQDNDILKELCFENNFLLLIIKLQKLLIKIGLTVGFPPKCQCR